MVEDYYDLLKRRIESDLASFADPGGVSVDRNGRAFDVIWEVRGETCEARLTASQDRGIKVTVDGQSEPYRVFLAGPRMADLRHMAQMIKRGRESEIFVPSRAQLAEADVPPSSATDLLTELVEESESDVTRVVMVTGEAGAGKTRVLQELVQRQAERYLNGLTDKLLLYVNAQGRALARLNEALATELQDLRANLTYHSVATLARVGLLVPVIDGFDELLGVSGYDDAFNSLSTFLEQMDGEGCLIASARSVYYEEEFLNRADRESTSGGHSWAHIPVRIVPWNDQDRIAYLDALSDRESLSEGDRGMLEKRVRGVFEGAEELASKPLFFARTVDLVRRDPSFSGGEDDLLGTLTHRYLEREQTEKLLDRQQRPLLPESRLEQLMEELAEEMWNQETRELDRRSVREVGEYVLDEKTVSESSRQIVVERIPTFAFLAPSVKHTSILFEHEIFFFHFLACAFANQYVRGSDMHIILSRSALPEFVAERIAFELRKRGRLSSLDELQEILDRLADAGRTEWHRTEQVRENAGVIIMALLREFGRDDGMQSEIVGRTISSVEFPGGHLGGVTLRECSLLDVTMHRTNLDGTKFVDCIARDVLLLEPRVRVGSTRMELIGLRIPTDVVGIRDLGEGGNNPFYDTERITRILEKCGAPVESSEADGVRNLPDDLMNLLQKLMNAYRRANPVCESDQNLQSLFRDQRWPVLRNLLVQHGIVKEESRPTSGSPKTFLRRRFSPEMILSGESRNSDVDRQIMQFWDALESEAA